MRKSKIIKKYNQIPRWIRWILFLPISFILAIIGWLTLALLTYLFGGSATVVDILHPVIVQIIFLIVVFYTVPSGKLKWVKSLIIFRSLFLLFFIAQPIINYLGANLFYDSSFFIDLAGEIITLITSIWLFKELKNSLKNKVD